MIPILYESNETEFTSNGLGRLHDCISCECSEERNGIYEVKFEYPITGLHYSDILLGRIIAVSHDETGDIQPFDIYSYSKPYNGVVTFHARHISYRQSGIVATETNIDSAYSALTSLRINTSIHNPFAYDTDIVKTGYLPYADGVPRTVKSFLGGGEGSILDTYGGEYEFDRFHVQLWEQRGELKNITVRYGVNMTEFTDEMNYSDSYNACVPYWQGENSIVIGQMQVLDNLNFDGRDYCVPLDVSDKFESMPSAGEVQLEGYNYMRNNQTYLPSRNIKVNFIQLKDSEEYKQFAGLEKCCLCDSVNVIFPLYDMAGVFKIVRVVWDVLQERYLEMELGNLPTSLAQALGISK